MMGPPRLLIIMALLGGALVSAQLQGDCGHASANAQAFIVNGRNATVTESPWHVGLYVYERRDKLTLACGGTLVHPRVVVTAAHCLYGIYRTYGKLLGPKDLKVSIGSSIRDWSQTSSGHVQHLNVSRLVPHPRYRGKDRFYAADIGVLILEQPVRFSAYVEPACMDWSGTDGPVLAEGSVGKVVGWGATRTYNRDHSTVLRAADLPVISFDKCSETLPRDSLPYLTDDKFCAGHIDGSSVAPGDSGGGLIFERDGLWFLMGMASVGRPDILTYSIFTNVTAFSGWIRNLVTTAEQGDSSEHAAENEGSSRPATTSNSKPMTPSETAIIWPALDFTEKKGLNFANRFGGNMGGEVPPSQPQRTQQSEAARPTTTSRPTTHTPMTPSTATADVSSLYFSSRFGTPSPGKELS